MQFANFALFHGDCMDGMRLLDACSVDSIVTDPPYELSNDGKASPELVFLELMFPEDAKIEADLSAGCHLSFLVEKVLSLGGVRLNPAPPSTMEVGSVALDDDPAQRQDDVEHMGKGSVTTSERDGSQDTEPQDAEYLGCFYLKLTNPTSILDALNRSGCGFLSGGIGVGFGVSSSAIPGLLCRSGVVNDSGHDVGLGDDPLSVRVCALGGAENVPVSRISAGRGPVDKIPAPSALVLLSALHSGGAQLVRARPGARGLPPKLEARRVRIVCDATRRAIALDLIVHPQILHSTGFMGKGWDGSKVAFDVATWTEALRVAKPGAHLLAFGGTRTHHRLMCAIEDAGWEIRDVMMWVYGQGMPKSRNGEWGGTALKPAWEPIILARKPLIGTVAANHAAHGTGGLNIDACRIPTGDKLGGGAEKSTTADQKGNEGWTRPWMDDPDQRDAHAARVRENVAKAEALGRWPANLLHDGSAEVVDAFPDAPGQQGDLRGHAKGRQSPHGVLGRMGPAADHLARGDAGSAARFFWSPKVTRKDRNEGMPDGEVNDHPTVKPTELMRYLVRLVTPVGGIALDPFNGSGSTGKAAVLEHRRFIGINLELDHYKIAEARILHALSNRDTTTEAT